MIKSIGGEGKYLRDVFWVYEQATFCCILR